MSFQLPDPSTPFGAKVASRLHEEFLIWLTTVDAKGTPQPAPVWFLWDDATSSILIYSRADAKRLEHLKQHSRVSLNFDGDGKGGNIITITGEARINTDEPSSDKVPAYVTKYHNFISSRFSTPENFARLYPIPLRIRPISVRGH